MTIPLQKSFVAFKNIFSILTKATVYLFFTLSFAGCASNLNQKTNFATPSTTSSIDISRANSAIGYFVSYKTYIDNRYVGELKRNSNLTVNITPGNHVVTVYVLNLYETSLSVKVVSRKNYFIKLDQNIMDDDPKITGKVAGIAASLNPEITYKTPKFLGKYLFFKLKLVEITN